MIEITVDASTVDDIVAGMHYTTLYLSSGMLPTTKNELVIRGPVWSQQVKVIAMWVQALADQQNCDIRDILEGVLDLLNTGAQYEIANRPVPEGYVR